MNNNLIHTLNQQVRYLNKQLNEQLNKHGLYHSQWLILYCLHTYGPMTQTEIWMYLNVEAPTVTRTLKRMEDNGWVKRTKGKDKRERLISLTETARVQYVEIEQSVQEFERKILQKITKQDHDNLLLLIKRLGSDGGK
ncbi:MarR family winged helix-turn-helix transcriptional regulator [Aquibacillus saliphilus]|uniref:MarR family winged helix-turn-helix transcriptional regulator n=1 Tax=Aquibacillus saliphilus TaxID=1909422 RepID=UPI001CEFEE05|nr:MarR family transcriptional regulator [Aquibacillus saliphilus]